MAEQTEYSLTYFPICGRGEPIRLMLVDAGASWSSSPPEGGWAAYKEAGFADGSLPFQQLPQLRLASGETFVQMNTIMRLLGRRLGTSGATPEEEARMSMALDAAEDWRGVYLKCIYHGRVSDEAVAEYAEASKTKQAPMFEAWLARAGSDFLTGAEPSAADFSLFALLDDSSHIVPDLLDGFPLLAAFVARVAARPNVAAYLASNPEHRATRNGNRLG